MIIYNKTKKEFISDIEDNLLVEILNQNFKNKLFHYTSNSEKKSWENSLSYMAEVIKISTLPEDCTIILEYNLPISSSRIDLMITGYDFNNKEKILIFELKQWSKVNLVDNSDVLLETFVGNSQRKVLHPAYQVLTYKDMLCDYNKFIQEHNAIIEASVILHNYKKDNIINFLIFDDLLSKVKMFYSDDKQNLIDYISKSFSKGDSSKIIYEIENSDFNPSKKLQNEITNLMTGNNNFRLLDDQMIIYDEILRSLLNNDNTVSIVIGGPGTGKSVIAINLLTSMLQKGKMTQYVSRNTAPRVVYSAELKGTLKKSNIDNLFKTSGAYTDTKEKSFDCLIVDEAHCMAEKSGLFNNYGFNQIKEVIISSNNSVFFIDEKQRIHLNDIGTIDEIKKWASACYKKVNIYELTSQFRCNGSRDYLSIIDYILGYNDKLNINNINYDIKICDNASELRKIISEKNIKFKSRVLAGYCWNWNKKEIDNTNYHDIKIDSFEMSWNLGAKQTYAIDDSINEVGCVHSVQGLEFDYVGVIIGKDMFFKDGRVHTDFHNHASTDPSFKGIKKLEKEDKAYANKIADELIKNAYRVLLTRGTKGCYIYCEDQNLNNFYKNIINNIRKYNNK